VTDRSVAVLAPRPAERAAAQGAAPPGVDPEEFRLAMLEDTYDMVAGLDLVTPALILRHEAWPAAEAITWPGTPIVRADSLTGAFDQLQKLGAEQAAVVTADAPDLPPLLIGKLFRAIEHAHAAVCPAAPRLDGSGEPTDGIVALAVPLPVPGWLRDFAAEADFGLFDLPDAFVRLRAAAPRSGLVQAGPGWHRLRDSADLGFLDTGLEGWENTRALLTGHPLP
jgi:hypothetical protein